jgi:preprotein translocase subunit SecE
MARIVTFFKEVRRELKRVLWPNRKELTTYTAVVLFAVGVVALIIWLVDAAYLQLINWVL